MTRRRLHRRPLRLADVLLLKIEHARTLALALLAALVLPHAARGQSFDVIHDFAGPDGDGPNGRMLQVGSDFFGTTLYGGTAGSGCPFECGTTFRMDADGTVTTLHTFQEATEGVRPGTGLALASDGNYYGTTNFGGQFGDGTTYRMDSSGAVTTLHEFDRETGGGLPQSALIVGTDGLLYGTTTYGRCEDLTDNCAVVYRMTLGGGVTALHTFGPDPDGGLAPEGPVIQAANGDFYGTTSRGGGGNPMVCGAGCGTIFHMTSNGAVDTLHAFDSDDGDFPGGALLLASDGKIYGVTLFGGTNHRGSIFRFDTLGNFESLHSFDGTDGGFPLSGLIEAADGGFYGTTENGGASGAGTLYRMDINGVVVTLHDFDAPPGLQLPLGLPEPTAELVQADDGRIFGVRVRGGANDKGFAFRFTPSSPPSYCPNAFVRRDQMAVFLLKTEHGSSFTPPACLGVFPDVACPSLFADWIEDLASEGITAGCGGGDYCPLSPITRQQMAVFLLKTEHGSSFTPPACTGVFPDVPCSSNFAPWIEALASEGVTGGCGGGNFCPTNPVTRAQMAVFLLKIEHGGSYVPPACTPLFADVACPSLFADWIEQLFAEQITAGCS